MPVEDAGGLTGPRRGVVLILVIVASILGTGLAFASGGWVIVPSPSIGTGDALSGVAVISSADVWAVGSYFPDQGGGNRALVEHWNGSAWSIVPSPNGQFGGQLYGVSGDSSSDVWAVGGTYYNGHTVVEHWNGSAWAIVPSPDANGAIASNLTGVAALSPADVWAAGYSLSSVGQYQALLEHWDGSSWNIVPDPQIKGGAGAYLRGVTALRIHGRDAVVAVGNTFEADNDWQTLVIATDGTFSKVVPSPNVSGSSFDWLQGVASTSLKDIWAVGGHVGGAAGGLIEHWDGRFWTILPSPSVGLTGVAAVAADDAWAVGTAGNGYGGLETVVEHWDGTSWSIVPSPNGGSGIDFDTLNAVAVAPGSGPWAVGLTFHRYAGPQVPLIEHSP